MRRASAFSVQKKQVVFLCLLRDSKYYYSQFSFCTQRIHSNESKDIAHVILGIPFVVFFFQITVTKLRNLTVPKCCSTNHMTRTGGSFTWLNGELFVREYVHFNHSRKLIVFWFPGPVEPRWTKQQTKELQFQPFKTKTWSFRSGLDWPPFLL